MLILRVSNDTYESSNDEAVSYRRDFRVSSSRIDQERV